jgi:phosphatidylglycerol---prolipoprotein diacylglyceryl transferase
MIPQILYLGPFPINSFGLMVALAIFSGIPILACSFKQAKIDPKLAEKYAVTAGISGIIGARLWYIIVNFPVIWEQARQAPTVGGILFALSEHVFASAGFIFYGGFLFAVPVLLFLMKRDGISPPQLVDTLGPGLALAYAIGRVGCQLSGDGDYGIATTSFLGMSYETGVVPTPPGILVFPAPFFESCASLLIFLFLLRIEERQIVTKPYARFGCYLALMSLERFAIEFIRINPKHVGFSQAQYIALGLLVTSLFLIVHNRKPVS